MAKQTINLGTAPSGAGGDTFRAGSAKLQANDDELYNQLGATAQGVLPTALPINKGGTGATTAAAARTSLGLGTAASKNIGESPGDVIGVGGFGLGGNSTISVEDFGIYRRNCFLAAQKGVVSYPGEYALGYQLNGINQWQVYLMQEVANNNVYFGRRKSPDEAITWSLARTTVNTAVDGNGFIKAASPVVKLFADKIESNDEAQLQDISFEKLGIGDYLIKGSSGFALEGWYVETPKDANGNVLFSVIYTTLENGDISVKTYKKKFDFETVSIVADLDNPVDITENRWVDLRLQELPQPEIEEPESITPPDFQPTGLAEAVATVMESYNDTEQ